MDRPVDAAAAEQRAVCGVYDRIDGKRRDVGDENVADGGAEREGQEGLRHSLILSPLPACGERSARTCAPGEGDWRYARKMPLTRLAALLLATLSPLRGAREKALRPLRLRLFVQIDRAAHADIAEMPVQTTLCR